MPPASRLMTRESERLKYSLAEYHIESMEENKKESGWKSFPTIFRVLFIWFLISLFFSLFQIRQTSQIGFYILGISLSGLLAILGYIFINILGLSLLCIAMWKRYNWTFLYSIIYFGYGCLNGVIIFISKSIANNSNLSGSGLFNGVILFGIVLNILFIYLFYRNKDYFLNSSLPTDNSASVSSYEEKSSNPWKIIGIVIGIILILCLVIFVFYKIGLSQVADTSKCEQITNISDRDMCYFDITDYVYDSKICDNIQEQRLRDNCYYDVARHDKNPETCSKIGVQSSKDGCYLGIVTELFLDCELIVPYSESATSKRSKCFESVLAKTNAQNICDRIVSPLEKEACNNKIYDK